MYNKLRVTKNGISEVKYCFSENDGQNNNSVASSVNRKSPPIRKIFVGNLSDSVSNTVTLFIFLSLSCAFNVFCKHDV
jgi:hypothetical protein